MKKTVALMFLLTFFTSLKGQISISEDFSSSSLPSGWTSNMSHSTSSNYSCNGPGGRYYNLWSSGTQYVYVTTSDYGSTISGSNIDVSFNFSVKEYSTYAATPAGEFAITFYYSTDNGSSWIPVNNSVVDGTNYTATTSCTSKTFSFASPTTSSIKFKLQTNRNTGDFYISYDDFVISETVPTCSGTPAVGNTVAEVGGNALSGSSVCSGETVDFTMDGTLSSDLTYQWQSSTDNSTWSNISGETGSTYSHTASSDVYIRCEATCPSSALTANATSFQLTIGTSTPSQPSALTLGTTTYNTIPLSWTAPGTAPDGYLAVYHTSALTANPVDGTNYSVGNTIGGGTVFYSSASTSASAYSLTSNTSYDITLFSYNETSSGCRSYNTTSAPSITGSTTPGTISSPSFSNEASSGFDMSWTAPTNGAASYLYTIYSDYYSTPVSSAYENVSTTSTSVTVTGLSSSSTYYVRIWAVGVGGTGSSYNAGSVSTLCGATSAPMTQDFGTTSTFNQCWSRFTGAITSSSTLTATTSGWVATTSSKPSAFTGAASYIYMYGYDGSFWLVSESIDLGNTAGLFKLKYDIALSYYSSFYYSTTLNGHQIDVLISDDDGATWSNTNILKTYDNSTTISNAGQTDSVSLTGYSGVVKIAFVVTEGANYSKYLTIDNFEIASLPACSGTPVPGNTLAEVSSTSVTSVCSGTTVDFSLQNAGSLGIGISYQWESSTDGTNYTTISGATSASYSGTVTADTYYRCATTCSGSTAYSTAQQVTINTTPTTQGSALSFTATQSSITPSWTAATDADGYLVIYHTSSLTAGPVDGTDYSTGDALGGGNVGYIGNLTTGTVSSLTANSSYDFTIYSYNASEDGCKKYNSTSPLTGSQYTTPGIISSPSFSNQATTGFDLSWNAPSNGATSYLYTVYSDYYSTPVSASYENVSTTSTSVSITGLTSSSTYYVRIWAVGTGGTGSSYNAGSVSTTCGVASAPMTQDFGTTSTFNQCWSRFTGSISTASTLTSTTSGWYTSTSSSKPSTFTSAFNTISAYGYDGSYWLVSESIDLGSSSITCKLKYDIALSSSSSFTSSTTLSTHQVDVLISDDNGATWSNANTLMTYTSASTISNAGQTESILLTGYSGTVKIAFVVTEGTYSYRYIAIDNFEIEVVPACSGTPSAETFASYSVSASSGSTSTLSPSSTASSTGLTYEWEESADSTNWSAISGATSSTLSYTVNSGVTYYRLKTTCTNSSASAYSAGVKVTGLSIITLASGSGGQTVSCGTDVLIYDNGGPSSMYSNSQSSYVVLENGGTGVITITGTSSTESSFDYLKIFSGSSASGTPKVSYTGTNKTVSCTSNPGETLTVQLYSDGSSVADGIDLTVTYSGSCSIVWDGSSWSATPGTSDDVSIEGNLTISANLEVGSVTVIGANIEVDPSYYVKINGDLNLDASSSLTLKSDTSNYSQLMLTGTCNNLGTITQEQFIPTRGWVNVTSSLKGLLASDMGTIGTSSQANFYYWDANNAQWSIVASTDSMISGRGYTAYYGTGGIADSGIRSISSTHLRAVNTDVDWSSLTASTNTPGNLISGSGGGWVMLGNPFTCNLDLGAVSGAPSYYIFDQKMGNGQGAYHSHSQGGLPNTVPPMQSFWIQLNGGSGNFGHVNQGNHGSFNNGKFHKTQIEDRLVLNVHSTLQPSLNDQLIYSFGSNCTLGYDDQWDAWKLQSPGTMPSLFSMENNEATAINVVNFGPTYTDALHLNTSFRSTDAGGQYVISLNTNYLTNTYSVTLEDLKTGNKQDLLLGDYTFINDPNWENRFVVHVNNGSSVSIDESNHQIADIYFAGNTLRILDEAMLMNGKLRMLDVSGRELAQWDLNSQTEYSINIDGVPAGVYFIEAGLMNGQTSLHKVIKGN